jgi:hypothetical protein
MKRVWKFAVVGLALCASLGAAGHARAQTLLGTLQNGSFTYGNETFTIGSCAYNGGACGSADNASIIAVANGRGGTEIEIAPGTVHTSYIFKTTTSASYTLNFLLQVSPTGDSLGISSITDLLTGTASVSGANSDVFASMTGTGLSPFSKVTSIVNANAAAQNFALVASPNAANFTINLGVTGVAGDTLQLTNVKLLLNPAPEPASIALVATGLMGLVAVRRRFSRQAQPSA